MRRGAVLAVAALAALGGALGTRLTRPCSSTERPVGGAAGLPSGTDDDAEAEHEQERRTWVAIERGQRERIATLESMLAEEQELRAERESEWLEFTQALTALEVPTAPLAPSFAAVEPADREEPGESAEEARARDREQERRLALSERRRIDLNALLVAEQVLGLDFLALGEVQDGRAGPVVVRLLDDWARPSGTLAAERLRLECSHAGRSITLVFEEGYESHGGMVTPFNAALTGKQRAGLRRIHLPDVDPGPWISALPELFDPTAMEQVTDDGRWDRTWVRQALNRLLEGHSYGGHWQLHRMGGVVGGILREVQVVELDDRGRVARRLFADRMQIERAGDAIQISLEDGMQERAGRRAPFLEGRYRIFLPRVDLRAWEAAGLPGLADAPLRAGD